MSLIFQDEHIVCNQCSSKLFEETQVFGIEPLKLKTNETVYRTIQPKYIINCHKCKHIIYEGEESMFRNK